MKTRPPNTLNHAQHDFLVNLAEDVPWRQAAEDVGWAHVTVKSQLYLLLHLLNMASAEDFDQNITAIRTEAKLRGYQNYVYYGMYDDEPPEQTIAELGEMPPRFVPVVPRPTT